MSTTPDLLYSETEDELRSALRGLLADRCDPASVIARTETDEPYDPALWKALGADMGLAGLLVPEELGGQGATHREAAVVLEELGRSVAPVPYLTSAVIATEVLLSGGTKGGAADQGLGEVAAELLTELAAGRRIAVLALPWTTAPGARIAGVRQQGGRLHGRITGVADAVAADTLLIPADGALYAVETGAEGVTVTAQTVLDPTRPTAVVELNGAPARVIADGEQVSELAVRTGLSAGAGLLASEQLGLADWCLTETVSHTRERHQFNRPVGSFQALKHRMAELWLEVVNSRAAARNAADALATAGDERALAVSLAQSYCAPVAVRVAEEALQLHGGIGMTWEHPVHLYLKRAKSDSLALGSAGHHRDVIAGLVNLAAP
ncbi:Acyl-CoA dehydrogenase [Streptomyces sp. YIM 130001]|uniref:acyl-CoA dehydrogenase family protein n=1 Tax=Streptomyces sp. YIM 130001 TaxID=2259644 RepID=UPI000E64C9F4|nr:acyl-CoA dehydrogenase family protein [Streptomyces sp. YIM 130001]RII09670.1 Acyl-CoA dehydrogenase [Streptomyces sp. YIM 130001]